MIGLRHPLLSLVKKVLSHFKIAPCQLMLNAWQILLSFQALGEIEKVDTSFESFRYLYALSYCEKSRVSISARIGTEPLIPYSKRSHSSSWKSRYILLREECVFGFEGPGDIPLFWQKRNGPINNDFPEELIPLAKSQVKKIRKVPWAKRQSTVLLAADSLAKTSIWSTCIELLGLEVEHLVRRFEKMENERVRMAPNFKDFYKEGGLGVKAKRPKELVAGTSIM